MDLNQTQPQSPVQSSPYEVASAPPPGSGGVAWNPSVGVRFGGSTAGAPTVTPPHSGTAPISAFDHSRPSPYSVPNNSRGYMDDGAGGGPQNFAQQLQQQFQQKQPARAQGQVQNQQHQQQQYQQQQQQQPTSPPPAYPPAPTSGQQNNRGWDPTKGLYFGGKPKN